MRRRKATAILAIAMAFTAMLPSAAFAEEEETVIELITSEGDPDFSSMEVGDWMNYEFNQDYSTVFSDITSYSHEDSRALLDMHWSHYLAILPYLTEENSEMTEEECIALLTEWHNARVSLEPTSDPEEKRIYLWEADNIPTVTDYTENEGYAYADDPDFAPYMLEVLLEDSSEAKGAVILCAGGGHVYRSNVEEAYESALALNEQGYQCFIVNYRVDPYTMEESGLDVARAVRYVRANAETYGIDENKIACAGFSAGGSVITEAIDKFMDEANAAEVAEGYVPDELDQVSADINAYLSIYANYDTESIDLEQFPETFFAIGGEDGWEAVSDCFDYVREAGIKSELHVFAGVPHGFGAGTYADGTYYENAAEWPVMADAFMQDVYSRNAAADAAE